MAHDPTASIPQAFVWRRVHSLLGLWLVIFLVQHLLVNSQAALLIGDDGRGFIHSVNRLNSLPYLPVIEVVLLGLPILIHLVWGIQYLRTAAYNSVQTDGTRPSLPQYPRNRAYTWQRVTAWLLVIGVVAHVIHMRFIERPLVAQRGADKSYMVRVDADRGLYTLAARLDVQLLDAAEVGDLRAIVGTASSTLAETPLDLVEEQEREQDEEWVNTASSLVLGEDQLLAIAKDFGTAELFVVRDTFKQPLMLVLYTLLVIAACYHAFNGLWTFLMKWGVALTARSQRTMVTVSHVLMLVVALLGLAAVWGTYWVNLKY